MGNKRETRAGAPGNESEARAGMMGRRKKLREGSLRNPVSKICEFSRKSANRVFPEKWQSLLKMKHLYRC